MNLYRPTSPPSDSNTALSFPGIGPSLWSFPFCLQLFCLLLFLQSFYIIFNIWPSLDLSLTKICRFKKLCLPSLLYHSPRYRFLTCLYISSLSSRITMIQLLCELLELGWRGQPHAWRSAHDSTSTSPYSRPWIQPFDSPLAKTHLTSLEVGTAYSSWLQCLPLSYHNLCPK